MMTTPKYLQSPVLLAEGPRRPAAPEAPAALSGDDLLGDLDPGWLDWRREASAA